MASSFLPPRNDMIVIKNDRNWRAQAQVFLRRRPDNTSTCPGCGFVAFSPGYDGNVHEDWSGVTCLKCNVEFCTNCLEYYDVDSDSSDAADMEFVCGGCALKAKESSSLCRRLYGAGQLLSLASSHRRGGHMVQTARRSGVPIQYGVKRREQEEGLGSRPALYVRPTILATPSKRLKRDE